MSETAKRGPYAKGVARREQILQEALAAYAESDSSGPSLRAIAARVGLSERGLLHYFASRDELLVAVLAERDVVDGNLIVRGATLADLSVVQAHSAQTPGLVRLFLEMAVAAADPSHAAHRFFPQRYARVSAMLQRLLRRTEKPSPPPADDAFIARMLMAASDGLQLQWLLDPTIDLQDDLARLGEILQGSRADS